ncbi:MAG: chromosomal replication initiator protein DnaA [Desulfobacula sp.]|nr:chromosomal replication initiator protein DnaA [Desulfobacula sp.]
MKNFELIWKDLRYHIQKKLSDSCFRMWIAPVQFLDCDGHILRLSSPNLYSVKRLKANYINVFKEELSKLGHPDIKIEFKVQEKTSSAKDLKRTAVSPTLKPKKSIQMTLPEIELKFNNGRLLKKGFTFDDFVVGGNSDFAYSASLSLAHSRRNGHNILYLLADTGLGKSHLSQAVGHHIITNTRTKSVYYVTAEDFTNEMIHSIKSNTIDQFKERYRKKCDVLLLEDIHFLAGKYGTQKELVNTLDYLLDADKKIILTSYEQPDSIPKLNDQLKSRISLGLVTKISTPDFETRIRILDKKAKTFGYAVPKDVTEYIAQELSDNVRQLESGLHSIAIKGQLMGYNIDIDLAGDVLGDIINVNKRISIDAIKKLVSKEFSVSEQEIISPSRQRKISKARQIAIFLSRKYTDQSLKIIGSNFNRYHATAIYAINAVEKELKQKGALSGQINYLSKKIESGKF